MTDETFLSCVAAAVAVSIATWRDATPRVHFPSTKELVGIELGRVLSSPRILRAHRIVLPPRVMAMCAAPPWEVDTSSLLKAYLAAVDDREALGEDIAARGHEHECMLPPKQKTYDDSSLRTLVTAVCRSMGCFSHRDGAFDRAKRTYDALHLACGGRLEFSAARELELN